MATISAFATRIQLLDILIQVDPRLEELERRLEESWPVHLADERQILETLIGDAVAAENENDWEGASYQLHCCFRILITHKTSVPQELMLWLVKRICVPLAFICQFRRQELETAFEALNFMMRFVWDEYDYGGRELTGVQVLLKNRVEAMAVSVAYAYAKLQDSRTIPVLDEASGQLSSEECTQDDVKARCCDVLCTQYYRLGQIGNVWFWLSEWQSCIKCIADSRQKEFQIRECLVVEASLCAEYGTHREKAEDLIVKLEELSSTLVDEDNESATFMQANVRHVIRTLRLGASGGDEEREGDAQIDLRMMNMLSQDLKERMEDRGLYNADEDLLVLDQKVRRSMDSARHEDAIGYLQKMVDCLGRHRLYTSTPSKLASAKGDLLFNQALCHNQLFQQKQLKFFIDNVSTSFSSASLKLCTHHCWSPYCQHERHTGCPPEGEEDEEDDEEFGRRHELETPTEFYTRRNMESDGNNLTHLEQAIKLLEEALCSVKQAGSDVFYVARVQTFLARTYLLTAESTSRRLLGYESWPLPAQITPEFLRSKKLHTFQHVLGYLHREGASPVQSLNLSQYHYRQCAQLFTKHLDSLKYYSDKWVHSIEKQKDLYVKLQNMLSTGLNFNMKLHDVLSKVENVPAQEVEHREAEYLRLLAEVVPEALLWSERGRARFLELQLYQRVQPKEMFVEQSRKDLYAFDSNDEDAWNVIRSSLDACGDGTVFLEYFCEDESEWMSREKTLGRVYGVKKASGKLMEPLLMRSLPGDPMELQSLLNHLHKSMDPESLPKYDEKKVAEDLEKLYELLITPEVARFLDGMQHDHKLVICPSQIFTKVPFAALRNPATKGYMFQSHTISITPSLRVLKYNKERYTALQNMELMEGLGTCVAMGDPHYRNESRRLKKSGEEVESVASLFPNRCELLKDRQATVGNLLHRAELPSQRSRSQAFVHIAAHCSTDDSNKKQGILELTELDCTDMPSSSSTPPDGVLSAENVVKSQTEWRTLMIVLSACGSGKGEITAEGVLNLPRAFMVAGVPCSVVSQWEVDDDSTPQLMTCFYQRMLKGVDVATALRFSMQEMLDNGHSIHQWAPFMVWGLPTICLPDELLSQDAAIELWRSGKKLIESQRHADAVLPLKKSLELMKAKESHTEEESNALVWCLWWLADCEKSSYHAAQTNEIKCRQLPSPLRGLKFASKSHLDDLNADQYRHLDSAIRYLNEALAYAKDGGFALDPPTQQVVHHRLSQIHHLRGKLCAVQLQDKPLPLDKITYGIQAVLQYYQFRGISCEDSWRKAFEHLIECAKLSSRDMDRSTKGTDAAIFSNDLLFDMRKVLSSRQGFLQLIKQNLIDRHHERLTSVDESAVLSCRQEFLSLMSRIAEKEMWLNRMYTPPWEELSLGWPTVPVDESTWDLLKVDSWKETRTLASGCGADLVVEYVLDTSNIENIFRISSPQKFLYICVTSQVRPPRFFVKEVNVVRLQTASMMCYHGNPESGGFLEALEYLHEILIKPILEDPIINSMHPQTLVFIPCELLERVPFALLRDDAQPEREGHLIQSHTISMVPSFRILERCSERVQELQRLPLMPDASDASLVLCNPAVPREETGAGTGDSGPAFIVDSHFPCQFKAVHGSDSHVNSLVIWASLPSSLTNKHCEAFFHMEAEIGEEIVEGVQEYGPDEWTVRMAIVRECQSATWQIHKETVLRLVKGFLTRGVPCAVMSNHFVDDVSSDVFFTHFYTQLKNGEGVAAAVRHSMLEMMEEGFALAQWGAFSVFGDPSVCLPQEMLRSNQEPMQT